jgi:hypothetical protein
MNYQKQPITIERQIALLKEVWKDRVPAIVENA